ncbi:MAG: DinB family protein [Arenibacter algicola]
MKIILTIGIGLFILNCHSQNDNASIRALLLEQLKNTHNKEDWFAPINVALDGVTAEQSNWRDNSENHSIGQLVSHLIFWNERVLNAFEGNTLPNFNDDNNITFIQYEGEQWALAIKKLDGIQTEWEKKVLSATDEQLKEWSSNIANVCSHNAYHTGQIIYIRKRNGWWRKTE